jgi:hypothetical protein
MKFTIALKHFSEEDTDATQFVVEAGGPDEAIRELVQTAAQNMTPETRAESCFWLAIVEPASDACLFCGTFFEDKAVLINRRTAARFQTMVRDAVSQFPELFDDRTSPQPGAKPKAAKC